MAVNFYRFTAKRIQPPVLWKSYSAKRKKPTSKQFRPSHNNRLHFQINPNKKTPPAKVVFTPAAPALFDVNLYNKRIAMDSASVKYTTVKAYLDAQPAKARALLQTLRKHVKQLAPGAEEVISYNIPAFKWHGLLVWYAGYKGHIGFYPKGSGIAAFKKEIAAYKNSRGAVQFPLNEPLPLELITRIVQFRMKENAAKKS
jgi:uncharacterized protein YdhG (YjbR/CyaY superfamily)